MKHYTDNESSFERAIGECDYGRLYKIDFKKRKKFCFAGADVKYTVSLSGHERSRMTKTVPGKLFMLSTHFDYRSV